MIDYAAIEEKWQKVWNENKVYEAEPSDKKELLVTAAWPYPDGPQHIGHLLTYGTADVYARYMRMKGYNVLFPMGIHKTGTPVLAIAKRVAAKDPEVYKEYESHLHIPKETIEKMTDPVFVSDYFGNEIIEGMKKIGFSIDWRRYFTSIDPIYSKMVEWQFQRLKEKGYLVQGKHAVGWCPNEGNAVGQHDTQHDVQPEIEEIPAIKFKDNDSDAYFLCATYRPETVYGVTNLFINGNAEYVEAELNGMRCYISKKAMEALSLQASVTEIRAVSANELLKKKAVNPVTNEIVPVLPGFFVKEGFATGIVMSVPAHAPFDYVALKRLENNGIDVPKEPYKKVIDLKGNGSLPSLEYLNMFAGDSEPDDSVIEKATEELYKEEAHNGIMLVGEYKGMNEAEARERIKEKLKQDGNSISIFVLANGPVYCRCGAEIVVKVVDNQWFINYGDEKWKEEVRDYFPNVRILPEKMAHTYENVIDWLNLRATERSQGLGTRFPFNKEHVIESLSDSTLYMAFYTFSNILKANNVSADVLKPEVFDYIFNSKGNAEEVASASGIDVLVLKKCKESFDYWYRNTSRHSASELIFSHLTMYLFNHVALLGKEYWPKQIVTNGMVLYEGQKMSKSMGNTIPVKEGIEKYNADPLRMAIIAQADLGSDSEFMIASVEGTKSRLEYLYSLIMGLDSLDGKELRQIDFWLYSKLNSKVKKATEFMDKLMVKSAANEIFFSSINELKRYVERGGSNRIVMQDYLSYIIRMLSPIMPHVSEEFWHQLGNSSFVVSESWPIADESMVNNELELAEEVVDSTIADAMQIIKLAGKMPANKGKKPAKATIIIASQWKVDAYNILAKYKDIKKAMELDVDKEKLASYCSKFKNLSELAEELKISEDTLYKSFSDACEYIKGKLGIDVKIEKEEESKSERAARAMPLRPSIEILWD